MISCLAEYNKNLQSNVKIKSLIWEKQQQQQKNNKSYLAEKKAQSVSRRQRQFGNGYECTGGDTGRGEQGGEYDDYEWRSRLYILL